MSVAEAIAEIKAQSPEARMAAVRKILGMDDILAESPEWHRPLVMEAHEDYVKNPAAGIPWAEARKKMFRGR